VLQKDENATVIIARYEITGNQSINQSINIRLLRHDKMQDNNSKQKGNTVSKKKKQVWKISQRTEPNMCSYIACVLGN